MRVLDDLRSLQPTKIRDYGVNARELTRVRTARMVLTGADDRVRLHRNVVGRASGRELFACPVN